MISRIGRLVRAVSQVVLDLDDTAFPAAQFEAISGFTDKFKFDTRVSELDSLLKVLRKKHFVDSIAIAEKDGTILASSNSTPLSEGIKVSALFNYINSEMPQSTAVMIKAGSWHMLYPYAGKIYLLKSHGCLTTIEMSVIAKEIEGFARN